MAESYKERIQRLSAALEAERKAEEDHYIQLSKNKSITEKIESGILWHPVDLLSSIYTVGELVELTLERKKHRDLPHKLKVGTGCLISRGDKRDPQNDLKGIVSFTRKNKIGVIISDKAFQKDDGFLDSGQLSIELIYDDRPYRVMSEALYALTKTTHQPIVHLRDIVHNRTSLPSGDYNYDSYSNFLNVSQKEALSGIVNTPDIGIIHGPPGTGKTTTLVEIIRNLVKHEKRILVCAPSNNAVDLLAVRLAAIGVKALRIGNVSRISDNATHLTLIEKARMDAEWNHIKKVRIEAEHARKQAAKYKRSFGPRERSNRNTLYKEYRDLKSWANDLEDRLLDRLLKESEVICTTLIGVSNKALEGLQFQTVIIDEASQALEPECWNAMLRANRVILAGDHLQLAPTVKSQEARKLGLEDTLLSRLTDRVRQSYLLSTQYRMNDKILGFSNRAFYEGKLQSHTDNADWSVDDEPITLIDTSGCGFDEKQNPTTLSRYNPEESYILREHFIQYRQNYSDATIGIISPYAAQVKLLEEMVASDDTFRDQSIRVNTIDGFQGQERDVIYISLVRSNNRGEVGFLADERRLNVALTRARKKLVILGDMSTLSQSQLFNSLAEYVEKEGCYKSAWEYMQAM